MTVDLTAAQAALLRELKVESPERLQELLARLAGALAKYVKEVMEPDQPLDVTRLEMLDLLLLILAHKPALATVDYSDVQVDQFTEAVAALLTIHGVFTHQVRLGEWKPRPVEVVLRASLPWRAKLRVKAGQVFFFDPDKLATYQDHNATGTIEEECSDLRTLLEAAKRDKAELASVGFTEEDLQTGERLLAEAEGRDVLGLIGVRNQAEMKLLRDKLLTLCVVLARQARATGLSAYWDDPDQAAKFERVSFRKAMRRLRPVHGKAEDAMDPVVTPVPAVPSTPPTPA